MDEMTTRLRGILARELTLHRDLLVMARLRHILLRQAGGADLQALRARESITVAELRRLEASREWITPRLRDPHAAVDLAEASHHIVTLLRRIGAVERANRALVARHAVRPVGEAAGVAVFRSSSS